MPRSSTLPALLRPIAFALFCLVALLGMPAAQAEITDCDRVAAHPSDPDKVLPGFSRAQIDLPKAIEICRRVLAEQPQHARTAFTLGRVLFYSQRTAESLPYLEQAAAAGGAGRALHFAPHFAQRAGKKGLPIDSQALCNSSFFLPLEIPKAHMRAPDEAVSVVGNRGRRNFS